MQIMGEEIIKTYKKKKKKGREGGRDFVTNIPDIGLDYNRQTTLFLCLFSHDSYQIARISVFSLYFFFFKRERRDRFIAELVSS